MRFWLLGFVLSLAATPILAAQSESLVGKWTVNGFEWNGETEQRLTAVIEFTPNGRYRFLKETKRGELRSSGAWALKENALHLSRQSMSIGSLVVVEPAGVLVHELVAFGENRVETKGNTGGVRWEWVLTRSGNESVTLSEPISATPSLSAVLVGNWCDTPPQKQADNPAADTWVFHGDGQFEYLAKTGGKGVAFWKLIGTRIEVRGEHEVSDEMSRDLVAYSTSGDMLVVRNRHNANATWFKGVCAK